MTWLIIALIVVAAFGPIFWLRPSGKDKRLSSLRAAARQAGLQVEIKFIPKLNPAPEERVSSGGKLRTSNHQLARYGWPLAKSLRRITPWRILRALDVGAATRPTITVSPGWVLDPEQALPQAANPGQGGWPESWTALQPALESLSQAGFEDSHKIVAVELEARQICLYWEEKPGSSPALVEVMALQLKEMETQLLALDKALKPTDPEEIP